ncbi:MAG: cytochrome c biogenesis protein [Candidatus Thermoplasmatota archaeon]
MMNYKHQRFFSSLILIFLFSLFLSAVATAEDSILSAPDFSTTDENGTEFSLSDYSGSVVILHFTGLESPLCIECLEEMKGQIVELEKLSEKNQNVTVITINIRKNPYSRTGKEMAEQDFNINISWHWVEDYSPYSIANLYQKYWTKDGAFSNPSIVLIDMNQSIVGVYHVYLMGRGPIDGVQSAESLMQDIQKIIDGTWEGFHGKIYEESITFIGIFLLGVLTAVTPCSLALLVAMISYVGTLQQDSQKSHKTFSMQGVWIGIVFTIGMALVFFVFGLILSSIGFFIEASALFFLIAGIILIILGINVFKPLKELIQLKSQRQSSSDVVEQGQKMFLKLSKKSVYFGAFFLGILFSIGWAPCALGLMLPVFILILAQDFSIVMGGLLLFVFGLGHGIPIIPLCAATTTIRGKLGNKYVLVGKWMQKIFGVLIVIIGMIMAIRFWGIKLW